MSSINDKAIARLLFAMLQQKNLKDMDWNQVASHPILLDPISNGHAARMRFSRFRDAMQKELDPSHRNRISDKPRVTKSKKKAIRGKKAQESDSAEAPNQHGSEADLSVSASRMNNGVQLPRPATATAATSATTTMPRRVVSDSHVHLQNRLMTPCSDSDILTMTSQGFAGSPASDMIHTEPFDFSPAAPAIGSIEQQSWHNSPVFPTFDMGYDLNGFSPTGYGEQQHQPHCHQHRSSEDFGLHDVIQQVMKNEDWDSQQQFSVV